MHHILDLDWLVVDGDAGGVVSAVVFDLALRVLRQILNVGCVYA